MQAPPRWRCRLGGGRRGEGPPPGGRFPASALLVAGPRPPSNRHATTGIRGRNVGRLGRGFAALCLAALLGPGEAWGKDAGSAELPAWDPAQDPLLTAAPDTWPMQDG